MILTAKIDHNQKISRNNSPSEERDALCFQLVELRLAVKAARLLVLMAAVEASDCASLSACSAISSSCLAVRAEKVSGINVALACQLRVGCSSLEL